MEVVGWDFKGSEEGGNKVGKGRWSEVESVTLKSKQGNEYHGSLKNRGQVKRHTERRKLVCMCVCVYV